MDLPDCPPGTEGYYDSVTEIPMKMKSDDETCTKAEQEFQEHVNSLKIKLENGDIRSMVERRDRDTAGKWKYLCYPCAAVCSGEAILQTHISGKKHKNKLASKSVWPITIFSEHPFFQGDKGAAKSSAASESKSSVEVDAQHNTQGHLSELDNKYEKYRKATCHIQETLDAVKAPLVGLEYLLEHPPEEAHYEPSYMCTLCSKQGHPRTIVNHMTCFWHRYNYILRHFPKAANVLTPYRVQAQYREGVSVVMNRLVQRIEGKYGRMRPVHIDKQEYEKNREEIHSWLFKGYHFSENCGPTFEDVVDVDLITSLKAAGKYEKPGALNPSKRDPSPPNVAAPVKPKFNSFTRSAARQERRAESVASLSDVSDEAPLDDYRPPLRNKAVSAQKPRFEPYNKLGEGGFRSRYAVVNVPDTGKNAKSKKPVNFSYKLKLAADMRQSEEESLKKTLAYHEKNPEKHPLYPEEWKKFWNRRYKEIQAEGKDPSKHDFKPEWILFWTKRMKELHEEELRVAVSEIYRRLNISPTPEEHKRHSPIPRLRSPEPRRRSPEPRRRSPDVRRRSPNVRRRSPIVRRRSPDPRRRSPEPPRRRSPEIRRHSPALRRPSMDRRRSPDYRRERSPNYRRSPPRHHSPARPIVHLRSRSPALQERARPRGRSPGPARTHFTLESARRSRSRSPLSRRDPPLRNRSPAQLPPAAAAPHPAPSMQTVLVSDDELKPDDGGLSPWNSDSDVESLGSLPDARSPRRGSREGSRASRASHASRGPRAPPRPRDRERERAAPPCDDMGPAENVVATLRLLVALEDYLGSLGPKVVDLLTEALKMEKERGNSSEELLEREAAVVLIETAKEKLKGAAQAGLVSGSAAAAVRRAVVRCAATLHEADTRASKRKQSAASKPAAAAAPPGGAGGGGGGAAVAVAGVGEVDRAQIAEQMAAALIAQGKTDVSSEELAQLVDAVVGMAEAKKREEAKKKAEAAKLSQQPDKMSGTATALQLLQSAYDENDKRVEKDDAPDAMDGLSDSDLETLLKNFSELSAEEQHSLIAYLKKLEAREPQRVERLRQYVSAAAVAPAPAPPAAPAAPAPAPSAPPATSAPAPASAPTSAPAAQPVTIESDDDDDYTVEEVFQSATQKVKEDKIRQEMEIVKKSLEETKVVTEPEQPQPQPQKPALSTVDLTKPLSTASDVTKHFSSASDLTKHLSSASDLFALVQASIQSTSTTPAPLKQADVVSTNTHPRSFGDLPQSKMDSTDTIKPLLQLRPAASMLQQTPPVVNQPSAEIEMNYGNRNDQNEFYDRNEPYDQNELHNENASYDQNDDYNQNVSFNQNTSYNQNASRNQNATHIQNESYNQNASYNQNQPYQNSSYNQNTSQNPNEPYNQNASHSQNAPYNQNTPHNVNEPYNQNAPLNQNTPHNQNAPFNQNTPHNQNAPYNQNTPHNQNAPYNQNTAHNQNAPYNQNVAHNQNAPYNQNAAHIQNAPFSRNAQNVPYNQNPSHNNQNSPYNQSASYNPNQMNVWEAPSVPGAPDAMPTRGAQPRAQDYNFGHAPRNQAPRGRGGKFGNGRMQDKNESRPQSQDNMQQQSFGNYDRKNSGRRGGGGRGRGNRGRGRGGFY